MDPIEAATWRAGIDRRQPTGLAVNAVEPARHQWHHLADRTETVLRFIEVRRSDGFPELSIRVAPVEV